MSIKINISYSTETELNEITAWLKPIKHKFSVKMVVKNKYKHLYLKEK